GGSGAGGAAGCARRVGPAPGPRVLDVACGTGNLALPAARAGAIVTGVDIAVNLLEQVRTRAAAEGVTARFEEGDAEKLPYPDASFDVVSQMRREVERGGRAVPPARDGPEPTGRRWAPPVATPHPGP